MLVRQNTPLALDLCAGDAEIAQYGILLDGLDIALLTYSVDASLQFRNAQAAALLGDELPAWINENGRPLTDSERPEMQVLETKSPQRGQMVGLSRTDGSTVWLKADAFPVQAEDGSVRRVILTLTDLTTQKTLQSKIEELAIRDPLTGVFNERHIMALLENETHRARRYGTPFTLAQIDIDHFLPFCETHGQQTGEMVLAGIGKLLRETIRDTDMAGRTGKDKFLLILPNVSLNDAMIGLERLRGQIESKTFAITGFKITVSGGITEYTGENPAALVERSASLLVHAREAGHNRFCVDADIL